MTPSKDNYHEAIKLMERIGGSFASNLAKAARCADSENWRKLHAAFPELFEQYRNLAATVRGEGA